jgi:hypothetical protein
MIDQLMETNIQLMKLATVILGTVGSERNRSDPLTQMNTQLAAVVTAPVVAAPAYPLAASDIATGSDH